ncbi:MAG: hypothetical protein LBP87_11555 [Planctomycetaceae bacterium]|jgi:hypothetical protein|nr:hypothetical protein [Planctomycetaceae bacterium]
MILSGLIYPECSWELNKKRRNNFVTLPARAGGNTKLRLLYTQNGIAVKSPDQRIIKGIPKIEHSNGFFVYSVQKVGNIYGKTLQRLKYSI